MGFVEPEEDLGTATGSLTNPFDKFLFSEGGGYSYGIGEGGSICEHLEISGYVLRALTADAKEGGNCEAAAHSVARFLMDTQHPGGLFPHSVGRDPLSACRRHEHHIFDAAVCATALHAYGTWFNDDEAIASGRRAVDWMMSQWYPHAGMPAVWDGRTKKYDHAARHGYWSSDGGCYLGKLIIPWMAYGLTEYCEEHAIRWLKRRQSNGFWAASDSNGKVHSHGLCYLLEGLLHFGFSTSCSETIRAVEGTLEALAFAIVREGGLSEWVGQKRAVYRADSQLQFLRLARIAGMEFPDSEEVVRARLKELSSPSGMGHSTSMPYFIPCWAAVFESSLERSRPGCIEELF